MIEVSGLCKSFGTVEALKNISFSVNSGEIVGFLGPNGAGKTTTLDILTGCLGADQGRIVIDGRDIMEDPINAKKSIGYLPDDPPLYRDMTVTEYVTYAAALRGVDGRIIKNQVRKTLDRLDLGTVSGRLVGHLSKGFRQRVGLAQAIVHDPKVLILDEPTEGLDPNQIVQIRDLIKELAGAHTILFSSHILHEVEQTCERFIIINKGQIALAPAHSEISKTQSNLFYVRLRSGEPAFIDKIKLLDGVSEVISNSRGVEVRFGVGSQNNRSKLLREFLAHDFDVVEFREVGSSLEDVFYDATREQGVIQ